MSTLCTKPITRTAVLASSDVSFRKRVSETLTGLRWQVREATGGADALAQLDADPAEALILDSWLPDLEMEEFVRDFRTQYPAVDLVSVNGAESDDGRVRSPRRHELLYAIRHGEDADGAIWNSAPISKSGISTQSSQRGLEKAVIGLTADPAWTSTAIADAIPESASISDLSQRLPELIGDHAAMLEVGRRVRLVASHHTAVLIQGPTGSGKELVARAIHRLSKRAHGPFVALNCAAIPEALMEAELFGHTRGAFTGAVQGRIGRIEAAGGGTLFLDEIGEMPLALQSKLLRFVECGELQRVGENEPVRVNVRIVTATHKPLAKLAQTGEFRPDLYFRLAVFVIRTPALRDHIADLPGMVNHFMSRLAVASPAKCVGREALQKLAAYRWPGNVRELEHVLECAAILAEERQQITPAEIEFHFEADAA